MISITTMGKFNGIPTRAASAKYGGGTSGGGIIVQEVKQKFPLIKVQNISKDDVNIYINVINIKEEDL